MTMYYDLVNWVNLTTSGTYFVGFKNMSNNLGYCSLGIESYDIINFTS